MISAHSDVTQTLCTEQSARRNGQKITLLYFGLYFNTRYLIFLYLLKITLLTLELGDRIEHETFFNKILSDVTVL